MQPVLDYIEAHLEDHIVVGELAEIACYSPSHFIWAFRRHVGMSPVEYVRRRKLTEAAREVLSGSDIVDVTFRYGFSAQDAFTRSFRNCIGTPPGRLRGLSGDTGEFTPAFVDERKGEEVVMLGYNLDCDPLESILRIEQLVTDEARAVVEQTAREGGIHVKYVDPRMCDNLCEARILSRDGETLRIATSVFLEDDLKLIADAACNWGSDLAGRIATETEGGEELDPQLRRLVVGMTGIDQGVFKILIAKGYAFDHRSTTGKYRGSKVDFYEECEAYDAFGPYLSGGYGVPGNRYSIKIIGQDRGIYKWLTSGVTPGDEAQLRFQLTSNRIIVDAVSDVLFGKSRDPEATAAAEAAELMSHGGVCVPIVREEDGPRLRSIVTSVRDAIDEFLALTMPEMRRFLSTTTPGRQGVPADRLVVDLMRYVRMVVHRDLYSNGVYADTLQDGGNITVVREAGVRLVEA